MQWFLSYSSSLRTLHPKLGALWYSLQHYLQQLRAGNNPRFQNQGSRKVIVVCMHHGIRLAIRKNNIFFAFCDYMDETGGKLIIEVSQKKTNTGDLTHVCVRKQTRVKKNKPLSQNCIYQSNGTSGLKGSRGWRVEGTWWGILALWWEDVMFTYLLKKCKSAPLKPTGIL